MMSDGATGLVRVFCGFSRGEGLVSRLIARVCAEPGDDVLTVPSHAFLVFEDGDGGKIYFEAREGTKQGWSGPWNFLLVEQWVRGNPRRWVRLYDVTAKLAPGVTADELLGRATRRLGIWRYATSQLGLMWLARRCGWRIFTNDPSRVVCSEAIVRIFNGAPEQGEHPALRRGCFRRWADDESPHDLERDLRRLGVRCTQIMASLGTFARG
jgi:hypothetical protein